MCNEARFCDGNHQHQPPRPAPPPLPTRALATTPKCNEAHYVMMVAITPPPSPKHAISHPRTAAFRAMKRMYVVVVDVTLMFVCGIHC